MLNLDFYSSKYENQILLEEINFEPTENTTEEFCSVYKFNGLVKTLTCYKNPKKPCIDLFFRNRPKIFNKTCN